MQTIAIIGTDWSGDTSNYRRQPFHSLDRRKREDWQNVFDELCAHARLPCLAVGIRGAYDTGAVASLPVARAAYDRALWQPTLAPWFDTVGLPDIVNAPGRGDVPFDFGNPQHIRWAWDRYARVFFDAFGETRLERTSRGRVLVLWWGIASTNGHGFTNQQYAQRLLDSIDLRLRDLGLGGADHVVDTTWLEHAPGLTVYGVHDWFNPWQTPPSAYSIRTHNGVTVGVTVPSFYERINPDGNADTIREALAAMRAAKADYVLIESGTNFVEGAELMRDATGSTAKLDAVRDHIYLTQGDPMDAVTKHPLLDFTVFSALLPGHTPETYALPWNDAKGEVDPSSDRVFSLQPDGTIQTRRKAWNVEGGIGAWESGRIVGDKLVFNTEGVAVKVFGVIRGV